MKLIKHDNGYALPIDPKMLQEAGLSVEADLSVYTDGHALVVLPTSKAVSSAEIEAALREGDRRFGRMLQRLA